MNKYGTYNVSIYRDLLIEFIMRTSDNFELIFFVLSFLVVILLASTLTIPLDHSPAVVAAKRHHDNSRSLAKHKIAMDIMSSLSSESSSPSSTLIFNNQQNNSIYPDLVGSDNNNNNNNNNAKALIITFDDGSQGQYTYAKPILDKYGFKATFFIVCNYANNNYGNAYMNWQQITQLQNDGMDVESHSMNHKDLTTIPVADLDYEIGQSIQCLLGHGINGNGTGIGVFAYPGHRGPDNPMIVNTVAKYYNMARSGDMPLQFLNIPANRYALAGINVALETQIDKKTKSYNDFQTSLEKFITLVNSQNKYNKNGEINAIPIIAYHKIDYNHSDNPGVSSTSPDLFDAEMKYMHDNGFKVLTMTNLRYNQNNNYIA